MEMQAPDVVQQARDLASRFFQLSMAVDQFRDDHFLELTPEMRGRLKDQAQHLDDLADHYTATAIGATLLKIQDDLASIGAVTLQAQQAVKRIQKVELVASIVSAGVSLGAAIFAGDPASIVAATNALVAAVTPKAAAGTST
jgi:hypothetical protein